MSVETASAPSSKVFVGGLAWATTDDSLRKAFEAYGPIVSAQVIIDRNTGRSRGFGFVTYEEAEDAKKAVDGMTDQDLDGRTIRCDLAQDRGDRSSGGSRGSFGGNRSSSYGGGRSSYGGGRSDSRRDGGYGRSDRREGGYGGERRSHRDDRGSYDRGDRYDRE